MFASAVRLWKHILPTTEGNDEYGRIARALNVLGVSIAVGIVPALLVQLAHGWQEEFWVLCSTELALAGTLALSRAGHVRWATRVMVLTMLACATLMVHFSGTGLKDQVVLMFPAIIVIGALLLEWRFFVGMTTALILVVAAEGIAEIHLLNPHVRRAKVTYTDLAFIIIILVVSAVATGMLAAELRRRLGKYKTLIREQGAGVIVLDREHRIVVANPWAENILGLRVNSLAGRNLSEFAAPEDLRAFAAEVAHRSHGEKCDVEIHVVRDDKVRRTLQLTATPQFDKGGLMKGMIGVFRDVTEARKMEEKVRLLAHALGSADNCICISDTRGHILYVNRSFLRTYGYEEGELIGQNIDLVRTSRDHAGLVDEILAAAMQDGWRGELWNKAKDGREFPILLATSVVRDDRGQAIAMVGVAQDITERKRAEEILKTSERRFRGLLENVRLVAVLLDLEGKVTFCNDCLLATTGRRRGEVVGRPFTDFVAADDHVLVLKILEYARRTGDPWPPYETAMTTAGGKYRQIQWHTTVLRESTGGVTGFAGLGVDVTEHRALNEQYLQAQKLEGVGRLAGGMAHDFNNLLTVINGYSEILSSTLEPESQCQTYVKQIRQAGNCAAGLTQQLLAFSRKQVTQPRPMDLNLVVTEAEKMLGRLLGEGVELSTKLSPTIGQVLADPNQLHQLLMNLAVNAKDAMPEGGRIVIDTQNVEVDERFAREHPEVAPGSYVHLGVTDTGVGMNEEVKQHLFDPFFTTKEKGKGTGLGLATVYGIVRQNKGWIWVWSEPGAGAAFHIYWPRFEAGGPALHEERAPAAVQHGSGTVLVVEDEDGVRGFIQAVLEECGYRILQTSNGPDALKLAQEYPGAIDLLVTDVVMPIMDGRALAERLQASQPAMKVLFTSGYTDDVIGQHGVLDPGVAYIAKPFSRSALSDKVRQTLGDLRRM